ncbi:hypothetical protein B0H66DRAFT_307282 [Apodospora peruviana]|uniref:RING-type domain-containing protein n=1 Tax=Apodospora peruviana TaxID=516989 RepID=A0AAE0I1J5_9PEZI|nr:hypothetical protein B0H66DRAFT_307282 [Apodospora peruviana]
MAITTGNQPDDRASMAQQPMVHHGIPVISITLCLVTVVVLILFCMSRKRWRQRMGVPVVSEGDVENVNSPATAATARTRTRRTGTRPPRKNLKKPVLEEEMLKEQIPVVKYSARWDHSPDIGTLEKLKGLRDDEEELEGHGEEVATGNVGLPGRQKEDAAALQAREKHKGNNGEGTEDSCAILRKDGGCKVESNELISSVVGNAQTEGGILVSDTGTRQETDIEDKPRPLSQASSCAAGSEKEIITHSDTCCTVCTDDFDDDDDVRVLPCHHTFHQKCIDPWLLGVTGTCPVCRTDLNPIIKPPAAASLSLPAVSGQAAEEEASLPQELPAPQHFRGEDAILEPPRPARIHV